MRGNLSSKRGIINVTICHKSNSTIQQSESARHQIGNKDLYDSKTENSSNERARTINQALHSFPNIETQQTRILNVAYQIYLTSVDE